MPQGDTVVPMTFWAASRHVTFYLVRECRRLYPNRKAIFSRQYADGRPRRSNTLFNRVPETGRSA